MTMDGTPYSYAYDRRGNLTEERQNGILTGQYTYDAANRMVLGKNIQSGEQTAYGYNGFDMRIKNIQTLLSGENQNPYTKETDYIPDLLSGAGNDLMSFQKITDVNDAVLTRNVYGIGYELISRYTMPISAGVPTTEAAEGTKTSFQPDIYGSPLFAVNAQGGILQYIERDIWGNQIGDRNAEGNFPFTTYHYDPVISKYFAQARFYDSTQGRMLAKDPVKRGLNGYPYCDNDPADYVDPTGEVPNIIAGGIIGGIVGGIAGFLGNSLSQIKKKEKYSLRKALGAAAKGAITGAAQGALTASGAGLANKAASLGKSLFTNFCAGFLGSMAEQKINKRRVNPREAIREGLISSIGDTLFGNSPLKGIGNAMIRGARSGAAVAAINNIFDSFTPTEQERIHDFMRNLPPGTTLVLELPGMRDDPRDECGGKNPFHDGVGYGLPNRTGKNGSSSNGSRKGFSLVDFLKDVAAGAVLGGLSGTAYYGGGKAVEALKKSIRRPVYEGALSLVFPTDQKVIDAAKVAPPTTDKLFMVVAHGNPYKIQVEPGVYEGAKEVAKRIMNSKEFVGGNQIVFLAACKTGAKPNGFAKQLANYLNVTVVAPDKFVYPVPLSESNKRYASGILYEYEDGRKEWEGGDWFFFRPDVKK
jgi:RHS repeat-associated protein